MNRRIALPAYIRIGNAAGAQLFHCSKRFALCIMLAVFASQSSAFANEPVSDDDVDRLVLSVHPHGIEYDEAHRLGVGAIPRLWAILDNPRHKLYWVNALVAMGFQEDPAVVSRLIEFYERTSRPGDVETLRAHLAVPFALGSIAANASDTAAHDFLSRRIEALSAQPSRVVAGVDLTREDLERMILGLALSGRPMAQDALRDLPGQAWFQAWDAVSGKHATTVMEQAREIAASIGREGRSAYFSYHPATATVREGALHPNGLPAPHQIAARRHVLTAYSNADLDADLSAGTNLLFTDDDLCAATGGDLACPVSFQRAADVTTFGADGDGLDMVTTQAELSAVFAVPDARVKVVTELEFCKVYNVSTVGCATIGGNTMVLEQGYTGTAVFTHEFGHNRGLDHRDDCSSNLMSSILGSNDKVVNRWECDAFGGDGATLPLTLQFKGDGSGTVEIGPSGQSCASDCTVEVPYAAQAQVLMHPASDSIAASCRTGCTYTMTSSQTAQIRFLRKATVAAIVSAIFVDDSSDVIFADGFEQ